MASSKSSRASSGPNLAAMDLNLLVAFEALWIERSVTAAGRRLGLSQPATSAALARLREMLGDRLFVRGKRGLEPTDRCAELASPLSRTLVDLRNLIAGSSFDPAKAQRQLRIGAVDAAIAVLAPHLLARTMKEAPNVQLHLVAIDPRRACELLDAGEMDLALSPRASTSATVRSRPLYAVEFVVAVRPGHPLLRARKGRDREALAAFPQVAVSFAGMPPSRAAVVLGSFLAVPPALAAGDAWALLPHPYAEALKREGTIATFPTPPGIAHPVLTMQLLWPEAQDAAPASKWLRAIIVDVSRATT
jgi:DNA-binding transcriptional LysR family regulator